MITGDNALTACHIAHEVEIVSRPVLIGDVWADGKFSWHSIEDAIQIPINLSLSKFDDRLDEYDLCLTGAGLSVVIDQPCFSALLPRIWVYARVSPIQKVFMYCLIQI